MGHSASELSCNKFFMNQLMDRTHEFQRQTSSNGPNMDTDEMTLCAKSESALKMPKDLILLASRVPNVACQRGKQH